ncbi:pentatricopeptide repeat-containing protein DOT4, chloroplastic-like [Selaginella moellendorffii]|uniref:pentatricopeptide repeat-containing protein DOT4, chloroplastic-like n=1 Tax=Selaginella moellendorffii TaxID=88036 RepID=UPI000D1C351E|nr:pentatricopeptide repeat-containing protein DOT4, chloroplastic-like [Selaginella moellendorffii]|eukprot:XP_024541471.1 pentatricopeptide repeat-containing protein DOT4, chloroplastic-like [Selaginella moellendorffii]
MLIATLKGCAMSRDLQRARRAHAEMEASGIGDSAKKCAVVANTMIDMYAKCGSMVEAQRAFDEMENHDVIAWTALINGYVDNDEPELAIKLFSSFRTSSGIRLDAASYLAGLRACSSLTAREPGKKLADGRIVKVRALEKGMEVHDGAVKDGCSSLFLASALVTFYSKCGSLGDARRVFASMPQHDLVSCNALMLVLAENGEEVAAMDLLKGLEQRGCVSNARTFLAALKACSNLAEKETGEQIDGRVVKVLSLERGREIHRKAEMILGREMTTFVSNTLVDMYCKCGSVIDARGVFERMASRSLVSWNALILGYAENGHGDAALELFSRMKLEGYAPDARTFAAGLKACEILVALDAGKKIYAEVCRTGLENEAGLASCVLDFHSRCGSMDESHRIFESLSSRDSVTWTALLFGYGRQGDTKGVFDLFHGMVDEGLEVDGITLLCILSACSHAGLVETGEAWFGSMSSKFAVTPSIEHYHCMVDIRGRANRVDDALALIQAMPFEPSTVTWRTLLAACKKWKNVAVGRIAFESLIRLDRRDTAVYLLMSSLYASTGMWSEQLRVEWLRRDCGDWKQAGRCWWSDRSGIVHCFMAGDLENHPQSLEIAAKLRDVLRGFEGGGGEKMVSLCGHCERIAVACALVNTAPGTTIRISKNLRVCDECHEVLGFISRVEGRSIVCRDASRLHVYRDGTCSCGEYW